MWVACFLDPEGPGGFVGSPRDSGWYRPLVAPPDPPSGQVLKLLLLLLGAARVLGLHSLSQSTKRENRDMVRFDVENESHKSQPSTMLVQGRHCATVSHCTIRYQTQLVLTTCQIRCHSLNIERDLKYHMPKRQDYAGVSTGGAHPTGGAAVLVCNAAATPPPPPTIINT